MTGAVITAQGLKKVYRRGTEDVVAVNGVSLEVMSKAVVELGIRRVDLQVPPAPLRSSRKLPRRCSPGNVHHLQPPCQKLLAVMPNGLSGCYQDWPTHKIQTMPSLDRRDRERMGSSHGSATARSAGTRTGRSIESEDVGPTDLTISIGVAGEHDHL